MKLRRSKQTPHAGTFDAWLEYGWDRGWCGPPVCVDHDGVPMTTEESDLVWDGEEICVFIIRLYEDAETKQAVEEAHSPSQWRASNRDWKPSEA